MVFIELDETEIKRILAQLLFEFPIREIKVDRRIVSSAVGSTELRSIMNGLLIAFSSLITLFSLSI